MNPLAALLASLTGAAQGQTGASTSSGAGTDLFAGLLAALGEGGEAALPGAPATPALVDGGAPASLLIALDGESGLVSVAGATPQGPLPDGMPVALSATTDGGSEDLLALFASAAGNTEAQAQPQAATTDAGGAEAAGGLALEAPIVEAGQLPADIETSRLAIASPQVSAKETDDEAASTEASNPLALLLADPGQTTPPVAEAPVQDQPDVPAAASKNLQTSAPGSVTPAAAAASATPPVPAAQPSPSTATPASRPAAGTAPAPQAQHSPFIIGAAQPGSAAPANSSAGDSQIAAAAGDDTSFAAELDSALDVSADAFRPDAAGRMKPPAGSSPLETLLQQAQSHQGDEQARVPPAVGAADMGSLPQQTRPAAPAAPSLPPVPIAAVAINIAQQAQAGAKRFEIRLEPPELGRVEVRLDVTREGHATTHLVVERSETLDMLQRDARQLERALQSAGLNTSNGDLTFSLKDQGNSHQQGLGGGEQKQAATEARPGNEPAEEEWQPVPTRRLGQAGIDIRI